MFSSVIMITAPENARRSPIIFLFVIVSFSNNPDRSIINIGFAPMNNELLMTGAYLLAKKKQMLYIEIPVRPRRANNNQSFLVILGMSFSTIHIIGNNKRAAPKKRKKEIVAGSKHSPTCL